MNVPRSIVRNLRRAPNGVRCPRYPGGFIGTLGSNRKGYKCITTHIFIFFNEGGIFVQGG